MIQMEEKGVLISDSERFIKVNKCKGVSQEHDETGVRSSGER